MAGGDIIPEGHTTPEGALEVGGAKFVPVYLGTANEKPTIAYLSQREEKFLARFIKTLNIQDAADEIGVKVPTAKRYLQKPNVRKVLDHLSEQAAIRAGTSLDETVVWLRKARDGVVAPSDVQVKCAATLAKILRPAGGGIHVNVQNNVGRFESPYKDMEADELKANMKERLDAIEGGPTGTA